MTNKSVSPDCLAFETQKHPEKYQFTLKMPKFFGERSLADHDHLVKERRENPSGSIGYTGLAISIN